MTNEENFAVFDQFFNSGKNFCALTVDRLESFNASGFKFCMVKVVDKKIVKERIFEFAPINITKKLQKELGKDVVAYYMSLPTFDTLWPEIGNMLESHRIVTYDMGCESKVLSYFLHHYQIEFGTFSCSFAATKTGWRLRKYLEKEGIELDEGNDLALPRLIAEIWMSDSEENAEKYWQRKMNRNF